MPASSPFAPCQCGRSSHARRRTWTIAIALALGFSLAAARAPAQTSTGNQGLVFSEFHYSASPVTNPGTLPPGISYIEILNRDVNISSPALVTQGLSLRCQRNGPLADAVFTIPSGLVIPSRGTLVISEAQIPGIPPAQPGVVLPKQQVVAQLFFQSGAGSNLDPLRPNVAQRICLVAPTAGQLNSDRVDLVGPVGGTPCLGTSFNVGPAGFFLPNPLGHINRVLFMDSDTAYDFDPGTPPPGAQFPRAPTPGWIRDASQNPASQGIDNVNGFLFGPGPTGQLLSASVPNPVPYQVAALPITTITGVSPVTTINSITLSGAPCSGISVPHHPRFPVITDPIFDRVLSGGQLSMSMSAVHGSDPLLGQPANSPLPFAGSMSWTLGVPPASGGTVGFLQIPMIAMVQADVRYGLAGSPGTVNGGRPRIERILTDNSPTDSMAQTFGGASGAQIDVIPGSTGGPDVWCDVIVYDENGFSYRAKVRNWPSNPTNCSTPTLGLGSNFRGNIDIIALCFTPQPTTRELYILPTQTISAPTGSGPFFGIIPDGMSLSGILAPLGTAPFHVQTTADGLYFFSLTLAAFPVGLMFDCAAVEVDPVSGFMQFAPAATVTLL